MSHQDPMTKLMVQYVESFINWAERNGARAYLNELGWPNNLSERDTFEWNRANREVLKLCNRRNVGAVCWDAGEMRRNYPFAPWQPVTNNFTPLAATMQNAIPWQSYFRGQRSPFGGVYLNTASQNAVWGNETTTQGSGSFKTGFSNVNRGTKGSDYGWDSATSMAYLAARNCKTVWIGFRWERLQPTLGAAFDTTYQTDFLATVDAAIAAGLKVVVQPFNKGAYYVDSGGGAGSYGIQHRIGNTADGTIVTNAMFNDMWTRVVGLCASRPGVIGYGLMNEPATGSMTLWQNTTQSAVDTIRALGDTRAIMVSCLTWQHAAGIAAAHPTPWITDSANNVFYGASFYWDGGNYGTPYDTVKSDSESGWLWLDHFVGTDGTIASGTRLGDIGKRAWLASGARIVSNQLAAVTNSADINRVAELPYGKYFVQIGTWDTTTANREHWVMFRMAWNANNDYWRFGLSGSTWYLQKKVNGTITTVASNVTTSTVPIASGQILSVDLDGPIITCSVGGTQVYQVTDTWLQGSAMNGISLSNTPNARIDWAGMRPNYHPKGVLP